MKYTTALLLTFLSLAAAAAHADPFPKGNAQAGQKFFDEHQCSQCHIAKMGGDGSGIFTRPNRIVHNPKELIARLLVCSGAAEVTLTEQNKQDLGAYLNQRYYKFE
jgi:mono/diheme cytochrome c family protein